GTRGRSEGSSWNRKWKSLVRNLNGNIQHPTSNIEPPMGLRRATSLDVGCWMLDVRCFPLFEMTKPLNIAVLLGGPSAEREVSLATGAGAAKALRALGHAVTEVDPKDGTFALPKATDVVFLALHGTYGEDGTVQSQLEKLGVPYTGCDAEASRVAFDKVLTKQRCIETGIPTARFVVVESEKMPW